MTGKLKYTIYAECLCNGGGITWQGK